MINDKPIIYHPSGLLSYANLFLASFLAIYFELIIIRYLSSEIRVFAYLKNLPLVASFFGLGVGMVLGKKEKIFTLILPFTAPALFLIIHFASALNITYLSFPVTDYFMWGSIFADGSPLILVLRFVGIVSLISALIVFFCIPLGSQIGRHIDDFPPLKGYFANLTGSIMGIGIFTLLAYVRTPPWIWIGIGSLFLLWFHWKMMAARIVLLTLPIILIFSPSNVFWSPYYRISLAPGETLSGEGAPSSYYLSVNYDYHQKILDLSADFFEKHPEEEPNFSARLTYDFPFLVHPNAKKVLIVGAGTGNDVAAALRNGAEYVDAVEIDPVILSIGKSLHPEQPYASSRVNVHIDDARAFFKKTSESYDLIVFAYLDSHTLIANSSSLRLDNYVYTIESLEEARTLLAPRGTLVLAFAAGHSFVSARIYNMLKDVIGVPPTAYATGYDGGGVVFVSGVNVSNAKVLSIPTINTQLEKIGVNILPATDRWPFLYLRDPTFPNLYYVIFILAILAWLFARRILEIESIFTFTNFHFFMLGAAFLLLETKAVTELSLLFGSTWIVNTIAILTFLLMAITANMLLMFSSPSRKIVYALLFASLFLSILFPIRILSHFPIVPKIFASGLVLALPVFFSGMLFSRGFRDVQHPGQALGVNLLGALFGGIAENAVMIGGTLLIGGIAVLFYSLSLVADLKR